MKYIEPLAKLIAELTKLPSVGEKTAARYAYSLLNASQSDIDALIDALKDVKEKVHFCNVCGAYTEDDVCEICQSRSNKTICVVTEPKDVVAMEKVKDFKGVYHVLQGVLSPLNGIGPEQLKIRELLARLGGVEEVIIATNPDIEGDATAMYLARLIKPLGVKVTRIARGLPEGSVIEYADENSLSRAMKSRIEI